MLAQKIHEAILELRVEKQVGYPIVNSKQGLENSYLRLVPTPGTLATGELDAFPGFPVRKKKRYGAVRYCISFFLSISKLCIS